LQEAAYFSREITMVSGQCFSKPLIYRSTVLMKYFWLFGQACWRPCMWSRSRHFGQGIDFHMESRATLKLADTKSVVLGALKLSKSVSIDCSFRLLLNSDQITAAGRSAAPVSTHDMPRLREARIKWSRRNAVGRLRFFGFRRIHCFDCFFHGFSSGFPAVF
jgi:hypothetical protein